VNGDASDMDDFRLSTPRQQQEGQQQGESFHASFSLVTGLTV